MTDESGMQVPSSSSRIGILPIGFFASSSAVLGTGISARSSKGMPFSRRTAWTFRTNMDGRAP